MSPILQLFVVLPSKGLLDLPCNFFYKINIITAISSQFLVLWMSKSIKQSWILLGCCLDKKKDKKEHFNFWAIFKGYFQNKQELLGEWETWAYTTTVSVLLPFTNSYNTIFSWFSHFCLAFDSFRMRCQLAIMCRGLVCSSVILSLTEPQQN